MDYDILFLSGNKEQTTKGIIIRALAAHYELTNTQMQKVLRKEFNKKISYQAIRQAVMELKDKNIIIKEQKKYKINPAWVLELKDITHTLEKSIIKKEQVKKIDKQTTQIVLRNLYELGHFVLFGLEHKYFNFTKDNEFYVQLNHLWIPFADITRREHLIRLFKGSETWVCINENTIGDKMLAQWYKKYCHVKLNTKNTALSEYMIQGDCVVQIYIPEKLQKRMKRIYSLKGILKSNLFNELSEMTYEENNIQVVITRNKEIAQRIKKNIRCHFP